MPIFLLFIASLAFTTLLFPWRVLHFIRTITTWLQHRRQTREAWKSRTEIIHEANATWKQYLDTEHTQLLKADTLEGKADQLRSSLAAGQRYLKSVSADECPNNYKHTAEFVGWAEQKLAEIDADGK